MAWDNDKAMKRLLELWPDHIVADIHGHVTDECPECQKLIKYGHWMWQQIDEQSTHTKQILQMNNNAMTPEEISKKLGTSISNVHQQLRRYAQFRWRIGYQVILIKDGSKQIFNSRYAAVKFLQIGSSQLKFTGRKIIDDYDVEISHGRIKVPITSQKRKPVRGCNMKK